MKTVKLDNILKNGGTVKYEFSVSDEIKRFFTGKDFVIEYPESIENVPDSVLAVPFVSNVLPIIWLTDSVLELDELDKAFYESIPEFKKGYIWMFSNADFLGDVRVKSLIDNSYEATGKSAMFYSGGLDSVQTLISHLDEKPDLLSIWGADIKFDNKDGWNLVHTAIEEAAEKFNLKESVFHSSLREFDDEGASNGEFMKALGDDWWHGARQGIGLLGHVAPYAYLHKISKMYIAASFTTEYGFRTCGSAPEIDNNVRFCGCRVHHDGYEYGRQAKVHNIVDFTKKANMTITLYVCWESQKGSNCCHCEKCYRTIWELLVEGADPTAFGFNNYSEYLADNQKAITVHLNQHKYNRVFYTEIQKTALSNLKIIKKSPYYKYFKWILKADFSSDDDLIMPVPRFFRLRQRLSNLSFYQYLHKVKIKMKS